MISYHIRTADPFRTSEAVARGNYYGVSGTPTTWFDGATSVVGGLHFGTMYPDYRQRFDMRVGVDSPLEITLDCTYDSVTNQGSVDATILNTSGSPVSGNLHFALIEDDMTWYWQGMDELHTLMRDMLPDASGESVSIPASDTIMRSRDFTIDGSWDELNCRIVVFIQAATRQIYQGAEIGIFEIPEMEYYGFSPVETSGNGNGIAEPGESMELNIAAKNMGTGHYDGTVSVQCDDPYITITGTNPASVSIGPGEVDTVVNVAFDIDGGCPDPYTTQFTIDFGSPVDTIPFVVTTRPFFFDDMESGEHAWTHGGFRDFWNLSERNSNSPTHSWYSGIEATGFYLHEMMSWLISPYFVAPPDTGLYFYHYYQLRSGSDYAYVDIDNGSGWWCTLEAFTGTQMSWTQFSYPIQEYAGQTIRIRYRFLTGYSQPPISQTGWFIDDINVPTEVGAEENENSRPQILSLNIYPNPSFTSTTISYEVTSNYTHPMAISIYDATGRLVRQFSSETTTQSNHIIWQGDDNLGRKLPGGIYFVKIDNTEQSLTEKVIFLR